MGGELIQLHSSTAPGAAQHLASMGISLSIAHKVGGTVSGCRIARSICRGVPLGPADLLGMFRWFARHTPPPKVDFDAPTHEAVEWLLRGGYPGRSWVRRQMVAATPPSLGWLSRNVPTTRAERVVVWKAWIDQYHAPIERALGARWSRYLREAQQRYISRVGDVLGSEKRSVSRGVISETLMREILAEIFEMEEAKGLTEDIVLRAVRLAFQQAVEDLPLDLTWNPELSPFESILQQMLAQVNGNTQAAVRKIVGEGITDGLGVSEIQAQLQTSVDFSPLRALRISRTETTRALNAGTDSALNDAAGEGLLVRKMWVSAEDSAVRPTHVMLDGQIIEAAEQFTTYKGDKASRPGGFDIPGEDINCRCGLRPVVE